jgi:tetratricopeptide (TPR) repeat protein
MGIVLLAYDEKMQRPVALKVLRPDRLDKRARERFVRETQAAARIEHDHVVPVYSVADPADGPPYLVMQYVEGPTLRERIQVEKRLDPKEAARIVGQIADGLAAVHRSGLVHRDIKPGNVLLDGTTGRAKIADFGLVQMASLPGRMTEEGVMLGTPEYMSPEQIRSSERLDARSDVYSLGVTLYEALTGEVPFRGVPHLVLQQVLNDEPRPPRRLNDRIPRDLGTICLKAMAKEPGQRYQTAQELADDLQRWLNGQPIQARPVGIVGKLWRWCRRKPAVASLLVVLVLVGVTSLAGWAGQWRRAEERRRQRDAESLLQARQLVDNFYTKVSQNKLWGKPGLRPLRKELLETALEYYKGFIEQRSDDLDLQAELADAHFRVAFITGEIGSKEKALAEYHQARQILEKLVRANPDTTTSQRTLATTYSNSGLLQSETGQLAEALRSYEQARAIREKLLRADPDATELSIELAASYNHIGILRYEMGKPAEAFQALDRARAIRQQLVDAHGGSTKYWVELAESYQNIGSLQRSLGRPSEALHSTNQACTILEKVPNADLDLNKLQTTRAIVYNQLGLLRTDARRSDEALVYHQKACAILEKLDRDNPGVNWIRSDLALTYTYIGMLHIKPKPVDAPELLPKARAILEELVEANPTVTKFRSQLAKTYTLLGLLQRSKGRPAEALDSLEKARAIQEKLVAADPDSAGKQSELGFVLNYVAEVLEALGRPGDAVVICKKAIVHQKAAFAKLPQRTLCRQRLSTCYFNLFRLNFNLARPAEMAAASLERQKLWPDNGTELYQVAWELAQCISFVDAAAQAERDKYARLACEALRHAIAAGFSNFFLLTKDKKLDSLRSYDEFTKLLAQVEKKVEMLSRITGPVGGILASSALGPIPVLPVLHLNLKEPVQPGR